MRAAVMEAVRAPLVVREVPDPACPRHGAIVRVEANGVCRSDWHGWVGDWDWVGFSFDFPHVLGHEMCGVIEEVGPEVRGFAAGERVIVPFCQGEGTCEMCREGLQHLCENGFAIGFAYWGGFGRYVAVPHADVNLVRLPEAIDFVAGASLGCRFMTAFHGVVDQAKVRAGEWVAVHGCGGVGLSAVQIASALGANVIGIDIGDEKLAAARRQGAVATVRATDGDAAAAVREITKGGAQVAIDALGIRATCVAAIHSLRARGRHLQIGLTGRAEQGEIALPIDLIVAKELTVVGSHGMQVPRYASMLAMIATGKLDPRSLVSRKIALEETAEVLAAMDHYATLGVPVIDRY
jgi:D-arabinose 1-dehydrogenase-like Zn-dependent alcohol dehydrogenase